MKEQKIHKVNSPSSSSEGELQSTKGFVPLEIEEVLMLQKGTSLHQSIFQQSYFYLQSNIKDIFRHKCHFLISTLSIFIVVLMCLVVNSVIDKAPIIFLRLAEKNSGEIDAFITPSRGVKTVGKGQDSRQVMATLNYTAVMEELPDINFTPRNLLRTDLQKIGTNRPPELNHNVMFMDTDRERQISLGRNYKFPKLKKDECVMSKKLMDENGFQLNERTILIFDATQHLNILATKMFVNSSFPVVDFSDAPLIPLECTIKYVLKEPLGKMDDYLIEDIIILEYEYMFEYIKDSLKVLLSQEEYKFVPKATKGIIFDFLETQSPYDYASILLMTFPEPRLNYYKNPDYNKLLEASLYEMTSISQELGYYTVDIKLPLLGQLQAFNLAILFMALLFSMILALFVVISIILIYGLLLVNVQQKSFENGIKRMVGSSKFGLIKDVIIQTFCFSTPGIIFAFFCSFFVLRAIYYFEFEKKLNLKMDPNPTYFAIINAIILGLVIPFISSLIPIKAALSKNLNDALDFEHSQTKGVIVKIIDPSNKNLGIVLIFGVISTIYGITIYVLLPQCLMALDFGTILAIFFLILIGLLLGLILITMNLQYVIEVGITKSLFWWERSFIRILILKNLIAHRVRNASTTLVYALSLSFLILCVVSYSLQIQNATLIKTRFWNDIRVGGSWGVNVYEIEPFIAQNSEKIKDFGYKSHSMNGWVFSNMYATPNSRYFSQPIQLIAISPTLFDSMRQDYIEINYASDSALSLSEQLYTKEGAHGAGIGSYFAKKMHIFTDKGEDHNSFLLNVQYFDDNSQNFFFKFKTDFILDAVPGIKLGKRKLTRNIEILVSFPTKEFIYRKARPDMHSFHVKYCFLTLTDPKYADYVIENLKSYTRVMSVYDAEKDIQEVKEILDVIFNVIISLSMFLCLFSLISSASANMMEQTKEIGVLRAIGFTKFMIKRLYFYETFVLVFASSCLGIIVGTFVGWTMTVQQAEFISIPISFYFPYKHLLGACFASVICAFVAIYSPTSFILSKQISEIFRIN
ncbi:unnamed protein product [Moneuplotes crassus]|uniref:ABC3 transporter permease C-terminal domain-containing protein n=2 Tax=Euplotes crassus TaxID=5936 RepID=A0AAD1U5L3_EUPCR|nr:unnamed protein product [Moneuplotes crassus]